jgi:hypothetical protein
MAENRNHDWPLCPESVCEEKGVYGCKGSKKETKQEIAWRVLREHVLEHNAMVEGVKIGKCTTNMQDRALGRYLYHDSQCIKQGLPGCLSYGESACRFCNVKDAKKANKDWPTCPEVVCDKYDQKSSHCLKLKQYDVPDEHPPEDWDMDSLPAEFDPLSDENGGDAEDEEENEYADDNSLQSSRHHNDNDEEENTSVSHPHHHHHSDENDDEDEEEEYNDDDEDTDADEDDDEYYSSSAYGSVNEDDDRESQHHHHHASGQLGETEVATEADLDPEILEDQVEPLHPNAKIVTSAVEASALDDAVFNAFATDGAI